MDRLIEFETVGGHQTAAVLGPPTATHAVLIAPALGVRASYYQRLAEQLAAQGLAAVAVDWPGFGASPVRAGWRQSWGYGALVDHVAAALAALRTQHLRLLVCGHSVGGQVAALLADQPGLVGALLVATGSPHLVSWSGTEALKNRLGMELCVVLSHVFGHLPGDRLGFAGREARQLIREWAQIGRTGSYRFKTFDGDARLRAPGPPVRAVVIDGDRLAPLPATRALLDRLTARDVELERWTDAPHGGDHNRWPSDPRHVVTRTLDFIATLERSA